MVQQINRNENFVSYGGSICFILQRAKKSAQKMTSNRQMVRHMQGIHMVLCRADLSYRPLIVEVGGSYAREDG